MSSSKHLLDSESDTGDYEIEGGSRMCVGGFPKKRCICFIVLAVVGVLLCMFFPIMFMGVAPSLAQSAVSSTKISLYNSHITEWIYPISDINDINVCESYHPRYLTVCNSSIFAPLCRRMVLACVQAFEAACYMAALTPPSIANKPQIVQDILFYDIPGFASLSPAWIMPFTADLYYEGEKFATLSMPMIDLSHPSGGKKWANGTSCMLHSWAYRSSSFTALAHYTGKRLLPCTNMHPTNE